MAAYDSLKSLVQQAIRTNGNNEITGQVLQNVLMAMIDELGGENGYAGVATPSTNPGAPDGKVFYFATEAGTYTHFDGATLAKGIHLLVFNGVTWSHQTLYTIDSEVTSGSNNLITSGAVYTKIINAINALDATVSKSAGADGLSLSLTEVGGKVTNISGSIAPQTYDAYGAASAAQIAAATDATNKVNAAKTQILGDAASDYNTLGKLEDKIQAEASRAAAAESALNTAKADKATTLAGYGINDAYTKTEVNGLVSTPHQNYVTVPTYASLPATGSADTIYRVSNYNGSTSQVDASVYSEYAWNGSGYTFLRVVSQIGEVFDITVYNSNTKYADLAAALGTNGANVPSSIRRGGMSVKFVQSYDNKYVRFDYLLEDATTNSKFMNVANWQGVDDEPIAGSENLVKSGGVQTAFDKKQINIFAFSDYRPQGMSNGDVYYDTLDKVLRRYKDGSTSIVPFYDGAIYSYNQQLYIWNGTDLVVIAKEIPIVVDKIWSFYTEGADITAKKARVQLISGHTYMFAFPNKWSHNNAGGGRIITISDGNDVDQYYTSSNIPDEVYIKANNYPLYNVYIRADVGEKAFVVIEDVTDTLKIQKESGEDIMYMYQVGSIKNNAAIGQVSPMEEDTDRNWRKLILPVKEGDIFEVNLEGSGNYIPWVLVDDNNIVIDKASSIINNSILRVPAGATKLVSTHSLTRYQYIIKYVSFDRLEKHSSLSELASFFSRDYTKIMTLGSIENNADVGSKPTLTIDTSDSQWSYIDLPVIAGERFVITGKSGTSARLWAVLDREGYLISKSGAALNVINEEIVIPQGGCRLLCNIQTRSGSTHFQYSLKGGVYSENISPYKKDVNFGGTSSEDYIGKGSDYSWGERNTNTINVYQKYDTLIDTNDDISDYTQDVTDGYITRSYIGLSSGSTPQPMVVYRFKPTLPTVGGRESNNPKIVVICGQHGFEKISAFAMYYLMNDAINNPTTSPFAKYIREMVDMIIVPVANPYGWDHLIYHNANDVQINRNWYVNNWEPGEPGTEHYGGVAPFDQPETYNIKNYLESIGMDDIFLLIDFHQNGAGFTQTIRNMNWIPIFAPNSGKWMDSYYDRLLDACTYQLSDITALFNDLYGQYIGASKTDIMGHIDYNEQSGAGNVDLWTLQQKNILSICHEGFGKFPLDESPYTNPLVKKANSELIGNCIRNILFYYSR